jgi:hypothetical protein
MYEQYNPFHQRVEEGDIIDIRKEDGQISKLKPVKCFGISFDN